MLSDEVVPKYVEEDGWSLNIIKKYHIVVDGKSFAVIRAECPDLLPKVCVYEGKEIFVWRCLVLCCMVLCCMVLCCMVLCCMVLYGVVLYGVG